MKIGIFTIFILLILITFSINNPKTINVAEGTMVTEDNNLSVAPSDIVLAEQNSEQQNFYLQKKNSSHSMMMKITKKKVHLERKAWKSTLHWLMLTQIKKMN